MTCVGSVGSALRLDLPQQEIVTIDHAEVITGMQVLEAHQRLEPPTLDASVYVSLAKEFRNQTDDLEGAVSEGDQLEFGLPTMLLWLRRLGTSPTFV